MKFLIRSLLLMVIVLITSSIKGHLHPISSGKCDVVEIYETITPDFGVKVLNTFGSLEDPELILVPTSLETGTYDVNITRKADNIYLLEGTNYCIQTSLCLEYSTYNDAILKMESNYGYIKGKVYFE